MTVAELIKILEKLPQDMTVAFEGAEFRHVDIAVSSVKVAGADYGLQVLIS
jgi:hypothetical protein